MKFPSIFRKRSVTKTPSTVPPLPREGDPAHTCQHIFQLREVAVYFQGEDGRVRDKREFMYICKKCGYQERSPIKAEKIGVIE